ncbi:MAG: ESPR domain-containing protein, partial [Neisseriaceae bacterium]|nr:ESPR domain-containing protein [Neisseriaceae bacterium]
MNRFFHKVIFNRNTGLMVVVAENACNNGKSNKDKRFQVALFSLSGSLQSDIVKANADEMNIIGGDVTADRAVLLTADKVNIASTTSTNK